MAKSTLKGNYTVVLRMFKKYLKDKQLPMKFEKIYIQDFMVSLSTKTVPFAYLKSLGGTFKLGLEMVEGNSDKYDQKCRSMSQGLLRAAAPFKPKVNKTPALSPQVLYKIIMEEVWNKQFLDVTPKTYRAVVCIIIEYIALARYSDISKLTPNDLSVQKDGDNQDMIVINFKSSKTDQLFEGANAVITKGKKHYNPVTIIKNYFSKLGLRFDGEGTDTRSLFPAFKPDIGKRRSYRVKPIDLENRSVSRSAILKDQITIVHKHGHVGRYTHVSAKAGGTTLAHQNGVPDKVIKEQGRWASTYMSDVYRRDNTIYKAKFVNEFMPGDDINE